MSKYDIVAICGKAGSGKDTILQEVLKQQPSWNPIISSTTRPKRDYEIDGKDYHFLTEEQFLNKSFIETSCFNDWYYGTAEENLREDAINVGVFNLEGIQKLEKNPLVTIIPFYVKCDNKERLLRQLNREENPDIYEIIRRFQTDEEDFKNIADKKIIRLVNNTKANLQECIESVIRCSNYILCSSFVLLL